jgi:osmotically-inducible protein OsmY
MDIIMRLKEKRLMPFLSYALLIATALLTSGCAAIALTGAAKTAVTAAEERSAGEALDDTGILLEIKHYFVQNDTNDLLVNVGVHVHEGRVLLTGNVKAADTTLHAVRFSWQAEGVREVINEIQVNQKSDFKNYARDVWIEKRIQAQLLLTKGIRSINYTVEVINDVVYLFGIAQDQRELDTVINIASTTSYVQKVISHVRMKDHPSRTAL